MMTALPPPPQVITTSTNLLFINEDDDTTCPLAVLAAPTVETPAANEEEEKQDEDTAPAPAVPDELSSPARFGSDINQYSKSLSTYRDANNVSVSEYELKAAGAAVISDSYLAKRRQIIIDFIDFLKTEPSKYAHLLQLVDTPTDFPITPVLIENVFVCFSGESEKQKKQQQLNLILINWVGNRRLKSTTSCNSLPFPQPSTLNMDLRAFMAGTKEYYLWTFGVSDFNFEGGYNGFFVKLMDERMLLDVSFENEYLRFNFFTNYNPSHLPHSFFVHS